MHFPTQPSQTYFARTVTALRHPLPLVALALLLPSLALAATAKVDICHRPPDNPGNENILTVGEPSLSDHLAHGDNVVGPEVCDAVDNDCDGIVDEDAAGDALTQDTTCGVGECAGNTGFETCVGGVFTNDTCDPLAGAMSEVCDTLDNDCDALVDEGPLGNPLTQLTTCGVGECAGNTGFETCVMGAYTADTCNPFEGIAPEVCDGLDNDCNGANDDSGDLCGLAEVCDATNGCIDDPTLYCPCDMDLDAAMFDQAAIPIGGCIEEDQFDGLPVYFNTTEYNFGPPDGYGIIFAIDADDMEPDGTWELSCRVGIDADGLGGNPPVFTENPILTSDDLVGCAARMYGLPENVIDCVTQ